MKGKEKPYQSLEDWVENCEWFQIGFMCLWLVIFISHYPFSIGFVDSIKNSFGNGLDSVARHGVRHGGIAGMWNGTLFLGSFVGTFGEWLWGAFVGFVKVTVVSIIIPLGCWPTRKVRILE